MNKGPNYIETNNTRINKDQFRDETGVVESVKTIINFPLEKLSYLKTISHKLIFTGENKQEQIIISAKVLEDISINTGIDLHKHITNPLVKAKILEFLELELDYGFVRYDFSSAIILLNVDKSKEGEKEIRNAGLSQKNINFILSNILKLPEQDDRINLISELTAKININNLSNEEIKLYLESKNHISYIYEIIKKEIFMLSLGNIDEEICAGITGFMLREYLSIEVSNKSVFVKHNYSINKVSLKTQDPIVLIKEILVNNSNIQNNIINPLFKKKLQAELGMENNCGLAYDEKKSSILVFKIADTDKGAKRYNGLNPEKIDYILKDIVKLHEKDIVKLHEKDYILMFLRNIIKNININKLSQVKLANIFNSGKYLKYISDSIAKEIFIIAKGNIDKEISIGIAGYIFREHFDFINSSIAQLLLEKLYYNTKLNSNNIYRIDIGSERKLINTITNIKEIFYMNMKFLINDIEVNKFRKSFSNDIFEDFTVVIKEHFLSIGINDLDSEIIRGIFRDINMNSSNYSVSNVFEEINKKMIELENVQNEYLKLNQPLAMAKVVLNLNIKTIDQLKNQIRESNLEKNNLENQLSNQKADLNSGFMGKFINKKVLENISNLEARILEIESKITFNKDRVPSLEKEKIALEQDLKNAQLNPELIKLEKEKSILENMIIRIKEDFANTLFYGFK